jgi:NitT/TauT family transport system permease protein
MVSDGRSSPKMRRLADSVGPPLVVGAGVIGLWYFVSLVVLEEGQRFLLPLPHEVVQTGLFKWRNLEEILLGMLRTTQVTIVGLAIAIVIGMSVAILMSQVYWVERTLFPYAIAVQAVPIIAIVPVIGLWMGFSFNARVLVTVIISLFPIITNTLFGIKSVDRGLHDLLTLHHASRFTRLWRLELPGAQPAIFTGFRIAAGLAVIGALVGEFFFRAGNERGLGRLLAVYQNRLQMKLLITAIAFSCLLGVALFAAFGALNNRFTGAWNEPASTGRN